MTPLGKVNRIIVHYSATYADMDIGRAEIDQWHRDRGFAMVGYHRVIRRNGAVELGRPEHLQGAHAGGANADSLGVCWVGGTERRSGPNVAVDNRSAAQSAALIAVIGEWLRKWPEARVIGHRDVSATLCPGFDVAAWWAGASPQEPTALTQWWASAPPGAVEWMRRMP